MNSSEPPFSKDAALCADRDFKPSTYNYPLRWLLQSDYDVSDLLSRFSAAKTLSKKIQICSEFLSSNDVVKKKRTEWAEALKKSDTEADYWKTVGNDRFKSGKYRKAVEFYSEALCWSEWIQHNHTVLEDCINSPYHENTKEDSKSNLQEEERDESKEFAAQCFNNRSAALSRLEEWRECEMDCGIALALGYRHADMRKKRAMIYHRRSVCRRKRGDKEKGMDDLTKARALLDDQRMNSLFDQEVKEDTVYTSSSSSSSSSDGAIPLYDYGCHAIDELPESELLPLSRRLCVSRNKLEGRFVLWNPTGEGQKCVSPSKTGDIVWVEAPYATVPLYETRMNHCHRCFHFASALLPAADSCLRRYCSLPCYHADAQERKDERGLCFWQQVHPALALAVKMLQRALRECGVARIAMNYREKQERSGDEEDYEEDDEGRKKEKKEKETEKKENESYSLDYGEVVSLSRFLQLDSSDEDDGSIEEKRILEQKLLSACMSMLPQYNRHPYDGLLEALLTGLALGNDGSSPLLRALGLVIQETDCDENDDGERKRENKKERELFQSLLIRLVCTVRTNAFGIWQLEPAYADKRTPTYRVSQLRVASAVFVRAALLFNHSCHPNAHLQYDGRRLVIRALKELAAGEPISISYGPVAGRDSIGMRKQQLREQYFFECRCIACDRGPQAKKKAKGQDEVVEKELSGYRCRNKQCEGELELIPSSPSSSLSSSSSSPSSSSSSSLSSSSSQSLSSSSTRSVYCCVKCKKRVTTELIEKLTLTADSLYQKGMRGVSEGSSPQVLQQSEQLLTECLKARKTLYTPFHHRIGQTYDSIAHMYSVEGEWKKCAKMVNASLQIVKHNFGEESPEVGHEMAKFAQVLFNAQLVFDCLEAISTARRILHLHFGTIEPHPTCYELDAMEKTLRQLIAGFKAQHKEVEAEEKEKKNGKR